MNCPRESRLPSCQAAGRWNFPPPLCAATINRADSDPLAHTSQRTCSGSLVPGSKSRWGVRAKAAIDRSQNGSTGSAKMALPLAAADRNALRANLVERAEQWRWGSLRARRAKDGAERPTLTPWPIERPHDWTARVNRPFGPKEEEAIVRSVQRGQPFGSESWWAEPAYVWGGRALRAVAPRSDSASFPGFFSILCSVFRDSVVTIFRVIS